MAGFVSLTHRLYFMNLGDGTGGTVTSAYAGGASASFNALANASLSIDAGLTVTIQTTLDNPDAGSAVWTTVATGITSTSNPYVISSPVAGIKITRSGGSGNVKGVGLESGGSSTVTAAGNVASGATDSGNPVKVGGVYNSTLPTFTTGQRADLQTDSNGRLIVTQGTLIRGENETLNRMMTIGSSTPTRITTATTTAVKASAGTVVGVFVEVALTGTVTLNDNVTTMIILPIGTIAGFHPFPASFATSLNVITSAADRLVTLTV